LGAASAGAGQDCRQEAAAAADGAGPARRPATPAGQRGRCGGPSHRRSLDVRRKHTSRPRATALSTVAGGRGSLSSKQEGLSPSARPRGARRARDRGDHADAADTEDTPMRGRKASAVDAVAQTEASAIAKERAQAIYQVYLGQCTVAQACARL